MCGITGIVDLRRNSSQTELLEKARAMAGAIRHRGPDGLAVWSNERWCAAFGFCRLSILDLSQAGMQPMVSSNGQHVLVFNGEIYNHLELRRRVDKLGRIRWRSRCDAESLVESIAAFGVSATLNICEGMFGFASIDLASGHMVLARDRFGEKSIYFGKRNGFLLFASELGAFDGLGLNISDVDFSAVGAYLRHTYVPAPLSIWRDVQKLEPGTSVLWALNEPGSLPKISAYWNSVDAAVEARGLTDDELGSDLEQSIDASVASKLKADVPVGIFLSGGIDSSLVAWKAAELSSRGVQAFTISFPVAGYDESEFARKVARELGIAIEVAGFGEKECLEAATMLPELLDEPFADSSFIPLFQLAKIARQSVKVALSGDGGDELFCGYGRYQLFASRVRAMRRFGAAGRLTFSLCAAALRLSPFRNLVDRNGGYARNPSTSSQSARAMARNFSDRASADPLTIYRAMTSFWKEPREICQLAGDGHFGLERSIGLSQFGETEWAQLYDIGSYLPNEILTKTDRATMRAGIEARCPFLDTRVYAAAWRIRESKKYYSYAGKQPLRDILRKRFPDSYFDRPKSGFTVPISHWLRGKLRGYAEEIVLEDSSAPHAILNREPLRRAWFRHLEGDCDNSPSLWTAIHLEQWLKHALARQGQAGGFLIRRKTNS